MADDSLLVVGAGIGGLTLAAALRGSRYRVTVLERADSTRIEGAGIQLGPNAVRLLDRLGLGERLRTLGVPARATHLVRWHDGSLIATSPLLDADGPTYGAPLVTIHRRDLHALLIDAVGPETIRRGDVIGADPPDGSGARLVRLADGRRLSADLVIGADGIGSATRELLMPPGARERTRFTVHRCVLPMASAPALFREPVTRIWIGPGAHVVSYPVRAGDALSLAVTTQEQPPGSVSDRTAGAAGVTGRAGAAEATRTPKVVDAAVDGRAPGLPGWAPAVRRALAAGSGWRSWTLSISDPPPRWSADGIVLLGDAAHPMAPFGAQGAAQSVEDAAVLAACLRAGGEMTLERRCAIYERLRLPRARQVVGYSWRQAEWLHLPDGPEQQARDAGFAGVPRGAMAWLYEYDALAPFAA